MLRAQQVINDLHRVNELRRYLHVASDRGAPHFHRASTSLQGGHAEGVARQRPLTQRRLPSTRDRHPLLSLLCLLCGVYCLLHRLLRGVLCSLLDGLCL